MRRALLPFFTITTLLFACSDDTTGTGGSGGKGGSGGEGLGPCAFGPEEDIPAPKLHTPRWAFEPWISKDISTGADTYAFVKGFRDRDIPVGAVVLDSPWETNYNTFVPNPNRYPDFATMVSDLHADNIRVVLWITALVNSVSYDLEMGGDAYDGPSPNVEEGRTCKLFVDDGADYPWWKGQGASVDFFNPAATRWWHRQQDPLFDMGIDGYKLDFGDSYVPTDPVATFAGPVPHQDYSEAYYHDFYAYGAFKRGPEFVTMVRGYDASYGFEGRFYARPEDAPVVWMGDNRRDYIGLEDALDHTFRSAVAGYTVLGSDIGGYLDRDDKDLTGPVIPFDPVVFARWTAVGALSPFMQLHGRANITPWDVPQQNDEIVNVYRYWAKFHRALVPFYYSLAEESYAGGLVIVRPIGDELSWPTDYRYMLGDAMLVAPILDATGVRDIDLPDGYRYYDHFAPGADPIQGGQVLFGYDATDIKKTPLFFREGAIVPLSVEDAENGFGDAASKGKITLLAYPSVTPSTFYLRDEAGGTTDIALAAAGAGFTLTLSRATLEVFARVRVDQAPTGVTSNGAGQIDLGDRAAWLGAPSGYYYDAAEKMLWIKIPASASAISIQVN